MSTLTSADLIIKRSSTRLHAPPGGVSSLHFGFGGLGIAEPRGDKIERAYSSSSNTGQYASSAINLCSSNNGKMGDFACYSTVQPEPNQDNRHAPSHQPSDQQQQYQHQSFNNDNNDFYQAHPPSTTPNSRSRIRSSSSSKSWNSQPPLTSSKRDQIWEKKRRLWLMRRNSNKNRSTSSFSSNNEQSRGVYENNMNPTSPLSKLMHQHAQHQQHQPQLSTYKTDNQRLDTARSTRSSFSTTRSNYQSYPHQSMTSKDGVGFSEGETYISSGVLPMASSTASGRRQPPGGQCQWSLG